MDARTQGSARPAASAPGWFWTWLLDASRLALYRFHDDETLVHAARAGNATAFDALEARHRIRIRDLARATLRDEREADRAARRTFVEARRDMHAALAASSTRAWLFEHALRAAFAIARREPDGNTGGMRGPDAAAVRHRMARAAYFLNERRAQRTW